MYSDSGPTAQRHPQDDHPTSPGAPQPKYPAKYASSAHAASASRYQNQRQYTPTLPAFAWTGPRDLAMVWAFRTAVIHKHLQKKQHAPALTACAFGVGDGEGDLF